MQSISIKIIVAIIVGVLIYDYFKKVIKFRQANPPGTVVRYTDGRKTHTGIIVSRKWHTAEVRDTVDRKIHKIDDIQIVKS